MLPASVVKEPEGPPPGLAAVPFGGAGESPFREKLQQMGDATPAHAGTIPKAEAGFMSARKEPAGPPPGLKATGFGGASAQLDVASFGAKPTLLPLTFGQPFAAAAIVEPSYPPPELASAAVFSPATTPATTGRKRVLEEMETDDNNEQENENDATFVYEPPKFASTEETNPHRLAQRQKQIDLGKNTLGYQNYVEQVPKHLRQKFNPIHPVTPDKKDGCSKRCFDGKIRAWRRALHVWDVLPGQKCDNRVQVQTKKVVKRMKMEVEDQEERSENNENANVEASDAAPSTIFDDFDM